MNISRLLLAIVAAVAVASPSPAADSRPNFLVILGDNLGRDWLGCYGSDERATPNIDRLAAGGTRFAHCYATPMCSTTRAELWTGRYGMTTGWYTHHDSAIYGGGGLDPRREITLARVLQSAGYATCLTGKWQINDLIEQPSALSEHGFDEHLVWTGSLVGEGNADQRWRQSLQGERELESRYWDPIVFRNGEKMQVQGRFGPDLYAEYLVDFISRHRNEPFFAFFSNPMVHVPVVKTPHDSDEVSPEREQFASMVRYFDHLVGELVAELERLKLRENTIVLFLTDNGSPERLGGYVDGVRVRGGLGKLTEPGLEVPLVANCPGRVPGGAVSDALIDCSDFFPTLAELACAELPPGVKIDGHSFAPALLGRAAASPARQWMFSQYHDTRVVNDGRYKLYSQGPLFDVVADPTEKNDLAESRQPDHVAAREKLQAVLAALPPNNELPFPFRSSSAFRIQERAQRAHEEKKAEAAQDQCDGDQCDGDQCEGDQPAPSGQDGNEPDTAETEASRRKAMAAAVAVSPLAEETAPSKVSGAKRSAEPVLLAKTARATEVDGRQYDVVVIGGTPGGIACAVRAARDGCSVLLVQHNRHIGGMMTNGLMQWDALYGGPRAPLFTELLGTIEQYYIDTFGRDSPTHQIIRYTHEHYPIGWVEPHVAEREFNRLVAAEKNITLLVDHYPASVKRNGAIIESVALRQLRDDDGKLVEAPPPDIHVSAATFVDGSYEGDLLALAGVAYRVGREARDEYHEPHAGKVFTNIARGPAPNVAAEGLNISLYGSHQGTIDSDSPFTADGAVQAYNVRFSVTNDPDNQAPIPRPATYDREEYVNYGRQYIAAHGGRCPAFKSHVNSPILPGENHEYPEADWPTRERIARRHLDFGLGLMWFLQNDESISEERRREYRLWGLPKDEYADNSHVPYEMYVRETRRLVGRHVFTQHDGMLADDYARTPIHADSVAVTDWYMDSHSCTTESRPGYNYDGKLILTEESRPAQIPYRALLPRDVDNLLVPVCLSATHIAWGSIRLEPVFMQTGEAAGVAAALAKREHTTVGKLDAELLLRTLIERRHLVSFFNDVKVTDDDPAIAAAQFFATRGFFANYNARLNEPLTQAVAAAWQAGFEQLQAGKLNAEQLAAQVHRAEQGDSPATKQTRREVLLEMWQQHAKEPQP